MMVWNSLAEGNPPATGRYVVAHVSHAKDVTFFHPDDPHRRYWRKLYYGGWCEDIGWATHWAVLEVPKGTQLWRLPLEEVEHRAWSSLAGALTGGSKAHG